MSLNDGYFTNHDIILKFRSEHVHSHRFEAKIAHETVDTEAASISNVNSVYKFLFLFENEKIKAVDSLSWLRIGRVVF